MVDSGATQHICRMKSWFKSINYKAATRTFKVAASTVVKSTGVGCVEIPLWDLQSEEMVVVEFGNVYYLPEQPFNLISVDQAMESLGFDNPDFRNLEWNCGGRRFALRLHRRLRYLESSITDSAASTSTALEETEEFQTSRETGNWCLILSEFVKLGKLYGKPTTGNFEVDCFTDGNGFQIDNCLCELGYSEKDSVFKYPLHGKFFYGNPVYTSKFLFKFLEKAVSDFAVDPKNTTHMFLIPVIPEATWWHFTKYFDRVHTYPLGSKIFTIPAKGSFKTELLEPAGKEAYGDRYFLEGLPFEVTVLHRDVNTAMKVDDHFKAHLVLGHYSSKHILQLIEQDIDLGFKLNKSILRKCKPPCNCNVCILAKMKRPGPFKPGAMMKRVILRPFQYLVSDMTGPIEPESITGFKLILHFTCVLTRWTFIYFIVHKDELLFYWKACLREIKKFGYSTEKLLLRSDNAKEYVHGAFGEFAADTGVSRELISPYMHEENALAEVVWRDLGNGARALMLMSGLDRRLWPLAYRHFNFIKNRMPNSGNHWKIAYFLVFHQHYKYDQLQPFGCDAYVWIDPKLRKKMESKSKRHIYVGNYEHTNAYCVMEPEFPFKTFPKGHPQFVINYNKLGRKMADWNLEDTLKLDFEKDLYERPKPFREELDTVHPLKIISHRAWHDADDTEDTIGLLHVEELSKLVGPFPHYWITVREFLVLNDGASTNQKHYDQLVSYMKGFLYLGNINQYYPLFTEVEAMSRRDALTKTYYPAIIVSFCSTDPEHEFCVVFHSNSEHTWGDIPMENMQFSDFAIVAGVVGEKLTFQPGYVPIQPINWRHAMSLPDANLWVEAQTTEMDSYITNGVLRLEEPPETGVFDVVDTTEVLKLKHNADGSVDKRRYRLCARGCFQTQGVSYDEVFAPTAQILSIRILLVICLSFALTAYHLDVAVAFMNSPLKYDIWIKLPTNWAGRGTFKHGKLLKSLYGLKQAAKDWYDLQDEFILNFDSRFKRSICEPCLYFIVLDDLMVYIMVYVDDYVVATNSAAFYKKFVAAFKSRFTVNELGIVAHLLQIGLTWTSAGLEMSQSRYIQNCLTKFGLSNAKGQSTPLPADIDLEKTTTDPDPKIPFRSMLGCALWLARNTRPDILAAVIYVSQFTCCYQNAHFMSLKRIFRYLKETEGMVFFYPKPKVSKQLVLKAYSDSDWAGDRTDRKSVSGHCVYLNDCLIDAGSTKQSAVATSSTEAEYVACSEGCKSVIHIKMFINEIMDGRFEVEAPVPVLIDNQGAIFIADNDVNNRRTKHIDIRFHAIRDWIRKNLISVFYVDTDNNIADMFTKALNIFKFEKFRSLLNVLYRKN
jgi:hypothetical protein